MIDIIKLLTILAVVIVGAAGNIMAGVATWYATVAIVSKFLFS